MTYEEFCKLPLEYRLGLRGERSAQRMYRNDAHGVQKEVVTPYNPGRMTWGTPKVSFFLDGDKREFLTAKDCWEAKQMEIFNA